MRATNTHPDYPHASWYEDRHGVRRWRFRRKDKTVALPGEPGEPEFNEAYAAAVEGRKPQKTKVIQHPRAAQPCTFRAAWRLVKDTVEWKRHGPATISKNTYLAELFLEMRIVSDNPATWGDMKVSDLKRRHVKKILSDLSETPHKAKHMLVAIRKMIAVALDEEWIEADPTWKLPYHPEYTGWRAWTEEEREKFEARWKIGTTARTAYALALWLGNRRSDVARLEWSCFDERRNVVRLTQKKTGAELVLPITPMLRDALSPLPRDTAAVLVTVYGKPFSEKALTGRMADWTHRAGLPKGCTLHGLRKTLGRMLAEEGATTRQIMETLGHEDIEHAELYSRAAEQERLARDGMTRVTRRYGKNKP